MFHFLSMRLFIANALVESWFSVAFRFHKMKLKKNKKKQMMRYLKMRFNADGGMRNVNIEQQNNSYLFKIIKASFIVFINMIIIRVSI